MSQESPLTGGLAAVEPRADGGGYWVSSPLEGRYSASRRVFATLKEGFPDHLRHRLLAAVRRASEAGTPLTLTPDNVIEFAESEREVEPLDLIDGLIALVYERGATAGEAIVLYPADDYPLLTAKHESALVWAISAAAAQGYVDAERMKGVRGILYEVSLTPGGWRRVREIRERGGNSDQAFVAMAFAAELDDAWESGIRPAFEGTGWTAYRVDKEEHNDRIDARIVAEINRSGLVVADVTGGRQGVYFEAGYALGRGLPVIWTVRKNYLKKVHFDTRQYNHVVWETPEDLRKRLHYRILATAPRTGRPLV